MSARRRTLTSVAGVFLVLLALTGCLPGSAEPHPSVSASPDAARVAALVSAVPHRSVASAPTMRLAAGLVPPTNRWFSGLVFGDEPQAVFPSPLSFSLTGRGFAFGLPTVVDSATTIAGAARNDVSVDLGASSTEVSAYDDVSVTIAFLDAAGAAIGHVTIAEGSPLVGFVAATDVTLALGVPFTGAEPRTADVDGRGYAQVTSVPSASTSVHLDAGQSATWFPVPDGGSARAVAASVSGPLEQVTTGHRAAGGRAVTELDYQAQGDRTVTVALPQQQAALLSRGCDLGTYDTILGRVKVCAGGSLRWSVPLLDAEDRLDLSTLTGTERAAVTGQLATDAGSLPATPDDSYFGGKALYRIANLLTIARQLGETDTADRLAKTLSTELATWTEPDGCARRSERCFVYDPAVRGLVGLAASFGSDQFNDHHFHYGYFLYAAGVLAADDPSVVPTLAPVMDLLAADIASPSASALFPVRRTFDPYTGHSWASGYSPFADGNNQESSSEAVNAWNGLALWARASGQQSLADEARWMLSAEADAATSQWTNAPLGAFPGYDGSIVALTWGGKRDYATWFSPEPNAMLGIQLIPMSPASGYLGADAHRIDANLVQATRAGYDVQFGDYLLMYRALAGQVSADRAMRDAAALPATAIDDADSRTYLLAWLASRSSG